MSETLDAKRQEEDGTTQRPGYSKHLDDFAALESGPIHEQSMKAKAEKEAREEAQVRWKAIIDDWRDNHPNKPLDQKKMFRDDTDEKFSDYNRHRFYHSLIGVEVEFVRDNRKWETGVCVDVDCDDRDRHVWLTIGMFDGNIYSAQITRCRIKGGWQDAERAKESVQSDTQSD